MQDWKRGASSVAGLTALALLAAACSPSSRTNTANLNVVGQPQQLQPVQNSTVQQTSLPAIGATGTPAAGLSGQPVLGGQTATTTTTTAALGANSSITTVGAPLTSGVSTGPEGAWNVVAAGQNCRLNLPLTAKTGTNYYRASAPGCTVPQIASVTGWQQVGSQLQLYDENGNIAAFLAPSGGRYIGTMGGGQAVSMAR
ncbi:protease inhibitor Inh/omp19 family protein [Devosia sp. XJ19-1]|uniref:Protease inhibitor Inh/omp19 family protein n=1 Tax=Devosia ureilytica TaxID=2952754 RepID=A0A9Q4AQ22_9HYPH|nr:AprI/Inh family metalloprotease inhibitor [Devosia ureilytica]MCP8884058.1 protease inhibitor Inh/omp19 family protein [Devosia ureilytica]MCP8887666.1 protease inhibitor Inh/omp19 family protein [Devosia ureilytica]